MNYAEKVMGLWHAFFVSNTYPSFRRLTVTPFTGPTGLSEDIRREEEDCVSKTNKTSSMCIQVDRQWVCGHTGYFQIKWCVLALNGCKGPGAKHEVMYIADKCDDCIRRESLPPPLDMGK